MNNLRGVYTIWYRDILRFWHDKMRMISSITFPLLFLFVFGSGLSARMGFLSPGVDFTQFMFPGIIGMTVLMSSFMAGISVVWDREFNQPCLSSCRQDTRCSHSGATPGGSHSTVCTADWHLSFGRDSAGTVTADAFTLCFHGLARYPVSLAYQVHGGVSGSDANVDVSYGVPVRSFLPVARATCMDERLGKAQSGYLRHCPNSPGNVGSITRLTFRYQRAGTHYVTLG